LLTFLHRYLIPESQSGAGALPALVLHLESPDVVPKFNSFGFSQNTLEEVFVKVSQGAMDFKRDGDSAVPLKPLGARDLNGGWPLLANQMLAMVYCRLVQLAPKRSFIQLMVFFSLSIGMVVLAGCMSIIQLQSPESGATYIRQPPLQLTPSAAFKNYLVTFAHEFLFHNLRNALFQSDVPFANPPSLTTVFTQGAAPLGFKQISGLTPTATSSIQDSINSKLATNEKYLESPFSVSILPDMSYALWINRQVTHALPVAIAWLANNDVQQQFAFHVTSSPLYNPPQIFPPNTHIGPRYFEPYILHIFMSFFVAVALSTVPCLAIRAVVTDRCVQTKHVLAGTPAVFVTLQRHSPPLILQSWGYHPPCTGSQTGCLTLRG
jgi:hypothetical protein